MDQLNNTSSLLPLFRKYRSFFISIGIFVLTVFLTFQFLLPNIQKIQEIVVSAQQQEQKLDQLRSKVTVLDSTNKTEELETLKKIIAVLPEEKDVFTIFSGIDTLEKETGVVITRSDFRVGVVSTGSARTSLIQRGEDNKLNVDIQFEAIGNEESILKLFELLGTVNTRLFTAKDVSIDYTNPDQITVGFILSAYFLPFPAQLGNVDSPLPVLSKDQQSLREVIAREALPAAQEVPDVPTGKTDLFAP